MQKETTQVLLPVMEAFYTLQGEGRYAGHAAYFIRLGGCDVGCVWCDVKESWDAANHPLLSVDQLVDLANKRQSFFSKGELDKLSKAENAAGVKPIVVITGGEPLMHDLSALTKALHDNGYKVNIETSGSHPISGAFDWICLSPKKFKAPLPEVMPLANELKVVVFNKSDFAWAEQYASLVSVDCLLYLQPEWSRRNEMAPLLVDYIKKYPKWQLSLQTHKYIDVP